MKQVLNFLSGVVILLGSVGWVIVGVLLIVDHGSRDSHFGWKILGTVAVTLATIYFFYGKRAFFKQSERSRISDENRVLELKIRQKELRDKLND